MAVHQEKKERGGVEGQVICVWQVLLQHFEDFNWEGNKQGPI